MRLFITKACLVALAMQGTSAQSRPKMGDTVEEDRFWRGFLVQGVDSMAEPTYKPGAKPVDPTPETADPTAAPTYTTSSPSPSPTAVPTTPSSSCQSLEQLVCSVPEFSTLCILVATADLGGALAEDNFTLFAPTNDAFDALPSDILDAVGSDMNLLRDVILYHTVPEQTLLARNLVCGESVMMGNQQETVTFCVGDGTLYQVGTGNSEDALPQIIGQDGVACNGIIHAVNQVILPVLADDTKDPTIVPVTADPTEAPVTVTTEPTNEPGPSCFSLGEAICTLPEFQLLCALVTTAGLIEALNGEEKITLFAPTNEAFETLPIELASQLTSDNELLTNVLLSHAVAGEVFFSDLECDGVLEMFSGRATTTVCLDNMVFQVGEGNTPANSPKIMAPDGATCNGVIHAIDQVILPAPASGETNAPTPVTLVPALETTFAPTVAPSDSSNSDPVDDPTCQSLTEVVCILPEFELLCSLIGLVDWAGALSGQNKLTIFAPVNDAFESLPLDISDAILEDPELLNTVLLSHVVEGEIFSTGLECDGEVAMISGEETTTLCEGNSIFQIGGGNADDSLPEIIAPDGVACNGVVHAIDRVILPGTI